MSATNLLRAYRYPRVTRTTSDELTPEAFFTGGQANTIYVLAAAHHQRELQPVILALVSAIYETAIERSRQHGPFDPALCLPLDETANIAPVRDLAAWLAQCGDHGITIATLWQSIAQIDHRYRKAERDAILAASTAQIFIAPIADPTTTGYIDELLGQEPIAQARRHRGLRANETLGVNQQQVVEPGWLRVTRSNSLLVYRDLPPAIVRAPGWYEDQRYKTTARRGLIKGSACGVGENRRWLLAIVLRFADRAIAATQIQRYLTTECASGRRHIEERVHSFR
jgi:type IV secretion system protein VirD4